MGARVIDGKSVASSVTEATHAVEMEKGVKPGLEVVVVVNDSAGQAYVNSKSKMAKPCGFNSNQHNLPEETVQKELEKLIIELNRVPVTEDGEGKSRLVGDVAYRGATDIAGAITPVPGGVGLMTIAMLKHFALLAAYRAEGKPLKLVI